MTKRKNPPRKPARTARAKRPAPRRTPAPHAPSGLSPILQPFVDRGVLAGAVTLVADRNRMLSLDCVGYADRAAQKPMRPDTLFWIASQTKPLTGALLMMLVDEGKVRLDDPVSTYLPEFKDSWVTVERDAQHLVLRRPTQPPTVRHLMSHTSGLPFQSAMEQPTLDGLSLRDAARSHAMTPLQWEPGSKYQYSNAGINTAGRIIETVTGLAYTDFLDRRLLRPLGMKDTTFWPTVRQLTRLAKPYKPTADQAGLEETTISQLRYPLSDRTRQPMPAGGLFSTAGDCARFCQMVLNGGIYAGRRYLSESAIQEMTSRQTSPSLPESYGLGWAVDTGAFGHGGALSTNMTINATRGLILVFLVQHAGFPGDGGQSQAAFKKAAEERFGS